MHIVVTGSSGLVGSNLVKRLEKKHVVSCLDKTTGFDLQDKDKIDNFFNTSKIDVVYHLAADAAESRGQISPVSMTQENSGIFVNVLKAAINNKISKFIFTSSVAVYGEAKVPYKEDGPTIPKDIYGINKLACEQMLKVMASVYKFNYVIFRPHNIYGPGQNMNDPYRNVVALFMRRLIENQSYKLYGSGEMQRAFSYVDDVIDVLEDSLSDKYNNKTINVGSTQNISIKQLSDLIQKISGKKVEIELVPSRQQEIEMFLADHSQQKELIDYKDTPIELGLSKTWDWVISNTLNPIISKKDEIYV